MNQRLQSYVKAGSSGVIEKSPVEIYQVKSGDGRRLDLSNMRGY